MTYRSIKKSTLTWVMMSYPCCDKLSTSPWASWKIWWNQTCISVNKASGLFSQSVRTSTGTCKCTNTEWKLVWRAALCCRRCYGEDGWRKGGKGTLKLNTFTPSSQVIGKTRRNLSSSTRIVESMIGLFVSIVLGCWTETKAEKMFKWVKAWLN